MKNLSKLIQIESQINSQKAALDSIQESIEELEKMIDQLKMHKTSINMELVQLNQEKMESGKNYLGITNGYSLGENPNSDVTKPKTEEELKAMKKESDLLLSRMNNRMMESTNGKKKSLLSTFAGVKK